jgi:hypothetical protein
MPIFVMREWKQTTRKQKQNNRTDNAMANKHSTACFRPGPSISSHRIIKSSNSFHFNQWRAKKYIDHRYIGWCLLF